MPQNFAVRYTRAMNATSKIRTLLQAKIDAQGRGAQTEIARSSGVSEAGVRAILKKGGTMTLDNAEKLAEAMGTSLAAILNDQDGRPDEWGSWGSPPQLPTLDDFVQIPRYDAGVSAGHGSIIDPHADPLGYYYFEAQWLAALTRAAGDMLAVVKVDGDSMEPTLFDGDWVLVDRSQRRLNRQGIYVIQVGDVIWIKRISLNLKSQTIQVISDNSHYPMQELSEEELSVIGRAVWIVGRKV